MRIINKYLLQKTFGETFFKNICLKQFQNKPFNRFNQIKCLSVNINKSVTIDEQKVRRELNKLKAEVVDIWDGMSLTQLSKAINKSKLDIKESIRILKIIDLDIKDIAKIVKFFDKKPNYIKNPSIVSKDYFNFDEEINKLLIKGKTEVSRVPVVTIMGHVDHGKTTLLDCLRKSELVKQEFGGITQHIGAFVVSLSHQNRSKTKDLVTFLDTPGHKAFSAMRERGANITDIVVLVVAIDDGVMEQTIESISFANSSNVPMIVAINKIDKTSNFKKDLEYLKNGLRAHGIVLEEDGGDIQSIRLSALKGTGIDELKEAIIALSETLEIKSYIDGSVGAVVLESSVDPKKGKSASILVQTGTLKKGNIIIAGQRSWAKVRAMFDEWGNVVDKCLPGFPVQVIGWREDELPNAGDIVWQLSGEKQVKDLIGSVKARDRRLRAEMDSNAAKKKMEEHFKTYKEELIALRSAGIKYKRKKNKGPREKMIQDEDQSNKLNTIVKCDVNGSLEVLLDIFESYPNEKSDAKIDLLHYGIGSITENEVELAACFHNSIIYAFNVGVVSPQINKLAKDLGVSIKRFNVIYHLVDDLKKEISDRLPLIDEEVIFGEAIVLQEFIVNDKHKKIPVAGVRCVKGVLKKNCLYRLIRREKQISTDLKVVSMRHIKDEVESIKKDVECGLRFDGIVGTEGIRFEPQDTIVCYEMKKIKQKTNWTPKGF